MSEMAWACTQGCRRERGKEEGGGRRVKVEAGTGAWQHGAWCGVCAGQAQK